MTAQTSQPSDTDTQQSLTFWVPGLPAAQGSKRHLGNGIMIESSKKLPGWRSDVRGTALEAITQTGWQNIPRGVPVATEEHFYFPRPKSHYRTGRNAHLLKDVAPTRPTSRNDIEKLVRGVHDALTSAGVWDDDGQVVTLITGKHYTDPDHTVPGCHITITPLEAP